MKAHNVKSLNCLIIVAAVLAMPVMAQERAATGSMDGEMTWSALSGQLSTSNLKLNALNMRLDQFNLCAAKGMLYAPGQAGMDASGCVPVTAATGVASCHDLYGWAGATLTCGSNEAITKVCSSGQDADCIAPNGQGTYTVITCCKIQ